MASAKEVLFATAVLEGASYVEARDGAGYSPKTSPSQIATRCIRKGLLPDPDALKEEIAALQDVRRDILERTVRILSEHADEVAMSLVEQALEGHLDAIDRYYARAIGPEEPRTNVNVNVDASEEPGDTRRRLKEILSALREAGVSSDE